MKIKIKSKLTKLDEGKKEKIRIFWVEENGQEVFGPTENPQECEKFIEENK